VVIRTRNEEGVEKEVVIEDVDSSNLPGIVAAAFGVAP
jgi:hypothetical protein